MKIDVMPVVLFVAVGTAAAAAPCSDWTLQPTRDAIEQVGGRAIGQLETEYADQETFVHLGSDAVIALPTEGLFHPKRGTIRFRVRPTWPGDDGQAHTFFHMGDGSAHVTVFKTDAGSLRFVYKASPSHYSACDANVAEWDPGQTHDISAGWTQNYSGALLLQLTVDGTRILKSGATALRKVPQEMFLGRRGLSSQPAEAWIGSFRLNDATPELPYATQPKSDVAALVDCADARPMRRVHDFTTIWNSRNNPLPFQVGDPEYQRFLDVRFRMVRLVAFSEGWLWGTRVELDEDGRLVTDFTDFDRLVDVFTAAGAEPYIRLAYHTPLALVDPDLPRDQRRYALPQDLGLWDRLMERIVRHVRVERKLPVRYWVAALNEGDIPVLRGQAEPDTIYRLYERTAKLVKRLDPQARVGGPALAWSVDADGGPVDMLVDFLQYCRRREVPLDFVCFHGYGKAHPRDYESLIRSIRNTVENEWPEQAGRMEYFLDEWNLWNRDGLQDNEYGATYLAAALHYQRRAGLTKSSIVSFNHFLPTNRPGAGSSGKTGSSSRDATSPVRFEYTDQTIARYTGLPLIKGPVVTTPYFVWLMHSRMGDRELSVELDGADGILDDDSAGLTATTSENRISLLLWHFDLLRKEPRLWTIRVDQLPQAFRQAAAVQLTDFRIDHDHNNPYTDYVIRRRDSNRGRYNLETAALKPFRREQLTVQDGQLVIEIPLPNMSVALLELEPAGK